MTLRWLFLMAALMPPGLSGRASPSLSLIPAGSFLRGDAAGEGLPAERPARAVYVSAFFIDRREVTQALWGEVYDWAGPRGYEIGPCGPGAPRHPVYGLDWHDAVKWCNARSEKDGLTPVYATHPDGRDVYRRGRLDLTAAHVRWQADGYRLPTEAEWEKAARGGLVGQSFPWPDAAREWTARIAGSHANYWNSGDPFESDDPYDDASAPSGYYPPQGYGLYDVAGNVWEWCWDWYDPDYYRRAPARDPRGPDRGAVRCLRGGSWASFPHELRCAYRKDYVAPSVRSWSCGLRCVRSAGALP